MAYEFRQINGQDVVNMTTAGYQEEPAVITFGNGTGAVFYRTSGTVSGRLLNAQGEPVGTEVTLATNTAWDSGKTTFGAAALSNGNIAVTWVEGGNVFAQIYNGHLSPVGDVILVQDHPSKDFTGTSVVATKNGGFLVSSTLYYSETDRDVYFKTFNASGTKLYDTAETSAGTRYGEPQVGVLANGNIAVAWVRYAENYETNTSIYTALYSPTLGVLRAPTEFPGSPGTFTRDPIILPRSDGSYIQTIYFSISGDIKRYLVSPDGTTTPLSGVYDVSGSSSAISGAGHTVLITSDDGTYASSTDIFAFLALPDGTMGWVENLTGSRGYKYDGAASWINPYTIQLVYESQAPGPNDGENTAIVTARYLVVHTQNGGSGPDSWVGDALIDVMNGNEGNDTMNGGAGPDTMAGGAGNDTYYVDNGGDVVDEQSAGSSGYDTVRSSISYALPNNVEGLVLLGSAGLTGIGNALANTITGNSGANLIDGSFGADAMRGLLGNDTYVVDNEGDFIDEFSPGNGGWDTVRSSIDYKLGPNLEALVLTGNSGIDGTGNGLANFIAGNGKVNVLKGGSGNDTVRGGGGKDNIDGGKGSDTADYSDKTKALSVSLDGSHSVTVKVKGKVEDTIKNIENLTGGSKGDVFKGDSKANSFDGGLGKDDFTGKGGNDKFVFSTALVATNADTITDFSHNHDKLVLALARVGSFIGTSLDKDEFYSKPGATHAKDAEDRVIYNESTGQLYVDTDGKGGAAAVLFAVIDNHASLDRGDFLIV